MKNRGDDLWLILALSVPAVHFAGGGYLAVGLAVLAVLPLSLIPGRDFRKLGQIAAFGEWIWICVVLAALLPAVSEYWPGSGLTAPVALLILAALGDEEKQMERTGNVLFWLCVLLAAAILLKSVRHVEMEWLKPAQGKWSWGMIVALQLPCLNDRKQEKWSLATGAVVTVGAVLVQGCLGTQSETVPIRELGRSMGAAGELATAVLMTLGWYIAGSWLFRRGIEFGISWGIDLKWGRTITCVLTVMLMCFRDTVQGWWMVLGCILMWLIVPICCACKNN